MVLEGVPAGAAGAGVAGTGVAGARSSTACSVAGVAGVVGIISSTVCSEAGAGVVVLEGDPAGAAGGGVARTGVEARFLTVCSRALLCASFLLLFFSLRFLFCTVSYSDPE